MQWELEKQGESGSERPEGKSGASLPIYPSDRLRLNPQLIARLITFFAPARRRPIAYTPLLPHAVALSNIAYLIIPPLR